ncbi:hypothetical protein KQI52_06445 [bacterium]|nr:hypothetical protein [bacterium]
MVIVAHAGPIPEIIRIYGGRDDELSKDLILTHDGRILTTGWTESHGDTLGDLQVMAMGLACDSMWSMTAGGTGGLEKGKEIVLLPGEGVLVAGYTESVPNDHRQGYLLRIGLDGNLVWSQQLGGTGRDGFFDLAPLADGTFLAVGDYQVDPYRDGWLYCFTASGDFVWQRFVGTDRDTRLFTACQLVDGSIICAGWSRPALPGTIPDIHLFALTESGDPLWDRIFGTGEQDIARRVRPLATGGFVMTGESELPEDEGAEQIVIARFQADGTLVWGLACGNEWLDQASDLAIDQDHAVYVVGTSEVNAEHETDVMLIRVTLSGELTWFSTHGSDADDLGRGIVIDPFGRLFVTGQTHHRFAIHRTDNFIARVLDSYLPGSQPAFLSSFDDAGIEFRRR